MRRRTNRNWIKRAAGLALTAALAVTACLPGAQMSAAAQEGAAMGRYLEEDVTLPEGMTYIYDLRVQQDGSIKALAGEMMYNKAYIIESSDSGQTWEVGDTVDVTFDGENSYLHQASLSEDGSAFLEVSANSGDAGHLTYYNRSPQGEYTQVELPFIEEEDFLYGTQYLEAGKVIATHAGDRKIYLFDDKTGEVLSTFNDNENASDIWAAVGGSIYMFSEGELYIWDAETKEERTDETLRQAVLENPQNVVLTTRSSSPILFAGGIDDESIYYCTRDGVYRHVDGGVLVEQIIDGSLNSIGNPAVGLVRMVQAPDGSFLLLTMEEMDNKLLRFVYSADTPSVPSKEIKVYSLQEDNNIKQAAALFQKQNPDYYVNLEVGAGGGDAVTQADAIRTLNTDILAGNGPDVLVLDGIPMDAYIEKGILADISDVAEDIRGTEELFENIAGTYAKDDMLYAIPGCFKMPMIVSEEAVVSQVDSLAALADAAASVRAEDAETPFIMSSYDIYWMLERLYSAYSPNLMREDGTVNEEAVAEFVREAKRIYDLDDHTDEDRNRWDFGSNVALDYSFDSIGMFLSSFLMQTERIGVGALTSLSDKMNVDSLEGQKGLTYASLDLTDGKVFVPMTIMGINSKSEHMEDAKEFLRFFFRASTQSKLNGIYSEGLSVNRTAFEKTAQECVDLGEKAVLSYSFGTNDGEWVEFETDPLSEESVASLRQMIDALDTPSLTDSVIHNTVIEQAGNCLYGQIGEEEAVNVIVQKLNLYLAE